MMGTSEVKIARPVMRYHGGKWMLATWIISNFPRHGIYVEPFCGAASVLMQKAPSRVEVLNDKYERIVNVFRVLRNHDQRMSLRYLLRYTPCSEAEYRACREKSADPVEDARRMLVLGHQGHGSTGPSGGKLTGWRRGVREHGRTNAKEWASVSEFIEAWAERLRGVYIESRDALDIIRQWDGRDVLFYVDPPYVQETRVCSFRGYAHEMTDQDHRELSGVLKNVEASVVLSGYPNRLYDNELFPDWIRVERKAVSDKGLKTTEVLWISPNSAMRRDIYKQAEIFAAQ
jgi:DNA adenine methylase